MRKKWWLTIALFLVLTVALAIGIPAFLPRAPGVTYANYSRIEKGMTRDDVVALLGSTWLEGPPMRWIWEGADDNQVWIDFDRDGRVVRSAWNGMTEERSNLERFRDRLPFVARKPPPPMWIEVL